MPRDFGGGWVGCAACILVWFWLCGLTSLWQQLAYFQYLKKKKKCLTYCCEYLRPNQLEEILAWVWCTGVRVSSVTLSWKNPEVCSCIFQHPITDRSLRTSQICLVISGFLFLLSEALAQKSFTDLVAAAHFLGAHHTGSSAVCILNASWFKHCKHRQTFSCLQLGLTKNENTCPGFKSCPFSLGRFPHESTSRLQVWSFRAKHSFSSFDCSFAQLEMQQLCQLIILYIDKDIFQELKKYLRVIVWQKSHISYAKGNFHIIRCHWWFFKFFL